MNRLSRAKLPLLLLLLLLPWTARGLPAPQAPAPDSAACPVPVTVPDSVIPAVPVVPDSSALPADSSRAGQAPADSAGHRIAPDSAFGRLAAPDTLAVPDTLVPQLAIPEPDSQMRALQQGLAPGADLLSYSGERVVFFPRRNVVVIQGRPVVESGGQKVSADSLIAYNRHTGEVIVAGNPKLSGEGAEEVTGSRVRYNLEYDRGIVEQGSTTFEEWYLHSRTLSKVGQDSIFGRDNEFTTCELAPAPHYQFFSPKIKVIRDKQVFAAPVILKFGRVPVFVLPFAFFPITQGNRKSGILQPRIGVNSVVRSGGTGRTFGNLGYFWAPNDYLDLLGAVDIRTASQTTLRGRTRYNKRYAYEGDFDFRRVRDKLNQSTGYSLFGRHNQSFSDRSRLVAEVNYTSTRNLLRNTSFDLQDLLRQSLRSTASYTWRPSWGSLNSSVRHEMFLDRDQARTVVSLPAVRLSLNQRGLFEYRARALPRRHGLISPAWLYNVTYGFNTDFSNTITSQAEDPDRVVYRSRSTLDLNSPQTLYGWLKMNPSLNYGTQLTHDNGPELADAFEHNQSLNFSSSLSSQFFGMFDGPRIGPAFRWRHTIQPRLSYNYQPGLGQTGSFGRQNRASLSITNDVDYKYYDRKGQVGEGGEPAVRNGKLFSLRNSLDYDFIRAARRDTLGWSDLNTSLTSQPASFLNLQLLANHELVDRRGPVERIDPFLNRLSTTVTMRGTYRGGQAGEEDLGDLEEQAYLESRQYPTTIGSAFGRSGLQGYEERRDLAFSRAMPWSVNLSHNLSRIREGRTTQSLRWSFTFNPTPSWHLVYSSSYNFAGHGLQGQTFILNRDLHCWQADLSLITLPGGRFEFVFSSYVIGNNALRLPDIRRASN